jgi:starch synthase
MAKSPRTTRTSPPADPTPRPPQALPAAGAPDQTDATPAEPVAAATPKVRAPRARKAAASSPPDAEVTAVPPRKTTRSAGTAKKTPAATRASRPAAAAKKPAAPKRRRVEAASGAVTAAVLEGAGASPDVAPLVPTLPPAADIVEPQGAEATPAAVAPPVTARVDEPSEAPSAGRPLRILMVASEAVPFAKTGGLADVAAALPKALGALGHDVTVVMPRYRGIPVSGAPARSYEVSLGAHQYQADVYLQETSPGVRMALVDHPAFFDRDALYGLGSHDYGDNPRRFAFLCLAALELARLEARPVDVVHAHDWQGGLAPVYLKTRYASDPVLGGAVSIFTIHNIAYQGLCASEWLPQLGLGWDLFTQDGLEFWLHASLLKGGIMFADLVTTVSPTYAQELLTPQFAFGFEGILRHRAADLVGILNGVDTDVWNPADDRHLPTPYSADDLSGKADAKRVLLDTYGLPGGEEMARRPVVAMISRMVDQKGLDLIASVAEQLPHLGAAFVILGTGEPWYEEMWRSLARRYPDRVGVRIGFDEPLSHVIEAGADLFMMPSRFEPCGLNQMYSLRYGTLPVVRATGGLDDTVQNFDPATGAGNGFKFNDASGEALLGTLRWALQVFHNDPERWRALQRAGMAVDFSWNASARAYLAAYERARTRVAGRQSAGV